MRGREVTNVRAANILIISIPYKVISNISIPSKLPLTIYIKVTLTISKAILTITIKVILTISIKVIFTIYIS